MYRTEIKIEDKKAYSALTTIYPYIMRRVNYRSWAKYISAVLEEYGKDRGRVLEIASGNSVIYKYLKKNFDYYLFSDQSLDMLKMIRAKNKKAVCFDMKAFPLKTEFDFIFSIFDSVNYLLTEDDLSRFFNECKRVLTSGGILTFDVGLLENSLRNLKQLNRKGKYKGINFEQISKFDPVKKIHLNMFEIEINNHIYREEHKQRIYNFETYFDILERCGLHVTECFNCFTFDDACPDSERAQFVVRKP